jgi:hypothetical protein
MTAGLLLSFVVSFAIGWFTVTLFWLPTAHDRTAQRLARIFLAFGIGQGMTSCLAFLYLLVHGSASSSYFVVELPVLAVVALLYVFAQRRGAVREAPFDSAPPRNDDAVRTRTVTLLAAAFYTSTAMALATIALRLWQSPHGGQDAWVIWNARARAIFRAGDAWRDDIYRVVIGHVHLDYPLLLPVSVVRAWMYGGGETTLAPALIALLFTAATIGLLVATVAALCGRAHAYTAGLVLLGYTFFVLHANSEQAEAPLIYFYLATLVLLAFHDRRAVAEHRFLMLAGVAAGFAAWTKNEGLLFVVAVALAHFAVAMRARNPGAYVREMLALAAGLLPLAAIILYFKTQLAPPNVWIADVTAPQLTAQVKDAGRYFAIAREFAKRLILYEGPGVNLCYLLLLFAVCFGITRRHIETVAQIAIALVIMFGGFVGVYLTMQANVLAFMAGSIDRVLLQLWPGFVLAFFLLATPPERDAAACGARTAAAD